MSHQNQVWYSTTLKKTSCGYPQDDSNKQTNKKTKKNKQTHLGDSTIFNQIMSDLPQNFMENFLCQIS